LAAYVRTSEWGAVGVTGLRWVLGIGGRDNGNWGQEGGVLTQRDSTGGGDGWGNYSHMAVQDNKTRRAGRVKQGKEELGGGGTELEGRVSGR